MLNKQYILTSLYKDYIDMASILGVVDLPSCGGNISVKDNNFIIIKPSGYDLKVSKVACVLQGDNNIGIIDNDTYDKNTILKPSMEIGFHRIIKNKYVMHYHPSYLLPYLCDPSYVFEEKTIDYITPGFELFKAIESEYDYKPKGVFLLRNHGVIVYGETIKDLKLIYDYLKNKYQIPNNNKYIPDDFVDNDSDELWLYRHAIENISRIIKLNIRCLSQQEKYLLSKSSDEKYRKNLIKE